MANRATKLHFHGAISFWSRAAFFSSGKQRLKFITRSTQTPRTLFQFSKDQHWIFGVIVQIVLLDMVFSIDSILTAVGMTDHLPVMVIAVVIAVTVMLAAAGPVSRFIHNNPSIVMLALGFLLMIGMVLIADGFGAHVPKGYVYSAMAFSMMVEFLNLLARRRARLEGRSAHATEAN